MQLTNLKPLNVCVTHFGDKYSSKYVHNLEDAIGRNYSGDFNFNVKTDCPNRHWDKISFFDCDTRTIVMDIDMVVCSNLDELFDYTVEEFAAFPRWWRGNVDVNGGFYIIEPSDQAKELKEEFYVDPDDYIESYGKSVGTAWMGEQAFVHDNLIIEELPPEWLGVWVDGVDHKGIIQDQGKFDKLYEDQFNTPMVDNIKLLHFIYENQIEQHQPWIQELWNGTSAA